MDSVDRVITLLETRLDDFKEMMLREFKDMKQRQDKTNGNVTSNSKDIIKLKIWRSWTVGFAACIILLFTIGLPILKKLGG